MTNEYESPPIQTPSQTLWQSADAYHDLYTPSTASDPCELENLTKVQEIIFKDEVFQSRDGKTIFSVHHEILYSRTPLNLHLRDSYSKDIVRLDLIPNVEGGGQNSYLQIVALPMHPLGYVKIESISGNLNICIQVTKDASTFVASLPRFQHEQRNMTIEILNMNRSHQVAKIISEDRGKSAQIAFSEYLDCCAKTVILGAFLYVNFYLHQISRTDNTSVNFQDIELVDGVERCGSSGQPFELEKGVDYSNNRSGRCCKCGPECMKFLCGLGSVFFFCANLASCCINWMRLWRMCVRS
ncbi:uncharacterized protein [Phyllobates terribilis]|uniref:uncharacterized protein n=1 Tax=Phyllobates terribilis TaxID=111132 RepID=UPI003CCA7C58